MLPLVLKLLLHKQYDSARPIGGASFQIYFVSTARISNEQILTDTWLIIIHIHYSPLN